MGKGSVNLDEESKLEENRFDLQFVLLFRHSSDQRFEDLEAVGATQLRFARAFGMRHHPEHVPAWVADARNVVERTVRIGMRGDLALGAGITKYNLLIALQVSQGGIVAEVVALHVTDGYGEHFAVAAGMSEGSVGVVHSYVDWLANVLQAYIAHQGAGQQSGLA
jgi:hypothetical protein